MKESKWPARWTYIRLLLEEMRLSVLVLQGVCNRGVNFKSIICNPYGCRLLNQTRLLLSDKIIIQSLFLKKGVQSEPGKWSRSLINHLTYAMLYIDIDYDDKITDDHSSRNMLLDSIHLTAYVQQPTRTWAFWLSAECWQTSTNFWALSKSKHTTDRKIITFGLQALFFNSCLARPAKIVRWISLWFLNEFIYIALLKCFNWDSSKNLNVGYVIKRKVE